MRRSEVLALDDGIEPRWPAPHFGSAGGLDLVDEMLGIAQPAPAKILLAIVQLDFPVGRNGGVDVLAHLLVIVAHAEIPEPGRDAGGRILLQEAEVQRALPGLEHIAAARELDHLSDAITVTV